VCFGFEIEKRWALIESPCVLRFSIALHSFLSFFNLLFCGQSCGQTFTMEGCSDPPELLGITPNSFVHIFADKQYLVRAAFHRNLQ
jgi:hypothetical protein